MRAPHADEIGSVREALDRAYAAGRLLARWAEAEATSGAPDRGLREAVEALLGAGAGRDALQRAVAGTVGLEGRLAALREAQHEALHDPAWAPLVAEVNALLGQRKAVEPELQAHRRRLGHLEAVAEAVGAQRARLEATPEAARPALDAALRRSVATLLEATALDDLTPDGLPPWPVLAERLQADRARVLAALDGSLATLQALTADLDARMG